MPSETREGFRVELQKDVLVNLLRELPVKLPRRNCRNSRKNSLRNFLKNEFFQEFSRKFIKLTQEEEKLTVEPLEEFPEEKFPVELL